MTSRVEEALSSWHELLERFIYAPSPEVEEVLIPRVLGVLPRLLPGGDLADEPDRWIAYNAVAGVVQQAPSLEWHWRLRLAARLHRATAESIPSGVPDSKFLKVLAHADALECDVRASIGSATPLANLTQMAGLLAIEIEMSGADDSHNPIAIHAESRARFAIARAANLVNTASDAISRFRDVYDYRRTHLSDQHPDTLRAQSALLAALGRALLTQQASTSEVMNVWRRTAVSITATLQVDRGSVCHTLVESMMSLYATDSVTGLQAMTYIGEVLVSAGLDRDHSDLIREMTLIQCSLLAAEQHIATDEAMEMGSALVSAVARSRGANRDLATADADRLTALAHAENCLNAALYLFSSTQPSSGFPDDLLSRLTPSSVTLVAGCRQSLAVYRDAAGSIISTPVAVPRHVLRSITGVEGDFRYRELTLSRVFWSSLGDLEIPRTREELYDALSGDVLPVLDLVKAAVRQLGAPPGTVIRGTGYWQIIPVHLVATPPKETARNLRKPPPRVAVLVGKTDGLQLVQTECEIVAAACQGEYLGRFTVEDAWKNPSLIATAEIVHVVGHVEYHPGDPLGAALATSGDEEAIQEQMRQLLAEGGFRFRSGHVFAGENTYTEFVKLGHLVALNADAVRAGALGDLTGQSWFLNACSAGASSIRFEAGYLGWPGALRTSGAVSVVAPNWNVLDIVGLSFAMFCYQDGVRRLDPGDVLRVTERMRLATRAEILSTCQTLVGLSACEEVGQALEYLSPERPFAHPMLWGAYSSF